MNRTLFLIGLIGFAIFFAVVVFLTQKKDNSLNSDKQIDKTQQVFVIPPPRTITFSENPEGAAYVYTGTNKSVPSKMQTYGVVEKDNLDSLYNLGTLLSDSLGITASPTSTLRGENYAYIRNDKYKWFSVSKTKNVSNVTFENILSLESGKILINKENPTSVLQKIEPKEAYSYVELPDSSNKNSDGLTLLDRPIPRISSHLYGVRLNGYLILTKEYTKRWASIFYDEEGELRLLSYIIPPTFTPLQEVSMISIDDAITNIQSGNGSILWLTQTSGEQYGVRPAFKRANLKRFSVVYIYDSNKIVPAYIFDGEGQSESGEMQIFEVLVRAYI